MRENHELSNQVKILNENLRRETEICISRDKENNTLMHENQTLKDLMSEVRNQSNTYKDD